MILCPSVTKANNNIRDPGKNNNYEKEKQKNNKVNPIKRHKTIFFKIIIFKSNYLEKSRVPIKIKIVMYDSIRNDMMNMSVFKTTSYLWPLVHRLQKLMMR